MMIYDITTTQLEPYLFGVAVTVSEDSETILTGETSVACDTQEEAEAYAEDIFLPDLRRNYPRLIGDLMLPGDVQPEPDEPEEVIEE